MRAVVQRVTEATLTIDRLSEHRIGKGLVILLGIEVEDGDSDIEWLSGKICRLRIFNDSGNVMNLSVMDVEGDVMVVSQFTLHASTRKGNRPSYINAASPEISNPLYKKFLAKMESDLGRSVTKGEFGSYMQIKLTNDGPITIIIDTKNRE